MNSQLVETRVIHRQDLFHKAKALFSQLLDSLLQAARWSCEEECTRSGEREGSLIVFLQPHPFPDHVRPVFC